MRRRLVLAAALVLLVAPAGRAEERVPDPGAPPAGLAGDKPKWKAWKDSVDASLHRSGSFSFEGPPLVDFYYSKEGGLRIDTHFLDGVGETCRIYLPIPSYRDLTPDKRRAFHRAHVQDRLASLMEGLVAAQERGQLGVRLCDQGLFELSLAEMRYVDKYFAFIDGNARQWYAMNRHMIQYYEQETFLMLEPSKDCRDTLLLAKHLYHSWTLGAFLGREKEFDGWLEQARRREQIIKDGVESSPLFRSDADIEPPAINAELAERTKNLEEWNESLIATIDWIERNRARIGENMSRLEAAFDPDACVQIDCGPEGATPR